MAVDMTVILLSAAFFVVVIFYIALEQEKRERITGIAFFIAALGGIVLYGFAYSHGHEGLFVHMSAVLRTLIDVGRMFVGMNNEAVFREALENAGLNGSVLVVLFWTVHFLAYYSMASAAIMALGKGAIRRLRQFLLRVKNVVVIYGVNDSSLAFGRHMSSDKHNSLVFVGRADSSQESVIRQMGALLYNDDVSLQPQKAFFKRLAMRDDKQKLHLYALDTNEDANIKYAVNLLKVLKEENFDPARTDLVLLGQEESHGGDLQVGKDHYGYGEVKAFDHAELTARLLVQKYPICKAVEFDDNGLAKADVEVLVIGFGHMGQDVLKKLVANGQFAGSSFHAHVFDPACGMIDGFFRRSYAGLLENYDVNFYPYSGQSVKFCDFLEEHAKTLTYIVIAVGSLKKGSELAYSIMELLNVYGRKMPVYQCCDDSVVCHRNHVESEYSCLHDADILYGGTMDEFAMKINHYYCGPDGSEKEQWFSSDYFSRMSCRASADFLSAYLFRLCGNQSIEISDKKMENMSITEHLRWCGFHYSMGYTKMSDEVWEKRAEEYRKEIALGGKGRTRISKDTADKRHACLVSWDELDALSAKESAVTGKDTDYKQMDRDNIKVVLKLLEENQ
ncbi:MAG: hypothetical protein IKW90_01120 [Lachnospiraceae bacterium]|nr:hypothetical protein [Lachnospiraceae bacterium]